MATPPSHKREKHDIPDPAEWMRQHSGETTNGPSGASHDPGPDGHKKTMTPGKHSGVSSSGTTKDSGAPQGFGGVPKSKEQQGQKPGKYTGSGKKKTELSPNNKKSAGSMVKKGDKLPYGMPSRDAMVRRVHPGFGGAVPQHNQPSRSGLLSRFEGFTPNPK